MDRSQRPTLQFGSTGDLVKKLQDELSVIGYKIRDDAGYFGQSTNSAVRSFQNDYGLRTDGIVGHLTWNMLDTVMLALRAENPAGISPVSTKNEVKKAEEDASVPKPAAEPPAPIIIQPETVPEQPMAVPETPMYDQTNQTPVTVTPPTYESIGAPYEYTPYPTYNAPEYTEYAPIGQNANTYPTVYPAAYAAAPVAAARPTVRPGDRNTYVTELQNMLKALGYFNDVPTGYFGNVTLYAVQRFQIAQKLTPDGVVGPVTWSALDAAYSGGGAPAAPSTALKEGSRGEAVVELQNNLKQLGYFNDTSTGYFGTVTKASVVAFQRDHGLTADGIAGSMTQAAIKAALAAQTTPPPQEAYPLLREGSTGQYVTILQNKLKQLGYFPGSVTGSFGPETTTAVVRFQQAAGLTPDGVVGSMTWTALENQGTAPAPPPSAPNRPTLRPGSSGSYVTELQTALKTLGFYNGSINGTFDNATLIAVKAFQGINGLSPDGVVGRATWYALDTTTPPPVVCG